METIQRDSITDLDGVSAAQKELLSAAGYTKVAQLSSKPAESIAAELEKANLKLNIAPLSPTADEISTWYSSEKNTAAANDSLKTPEITTLLLEEELHFAPVALTVSEEDLLTAGISLEEISYAKKAESNDHFICCTEENRPVERSVNESLDQVLATKNKIDSGPILPQTSSNLKIDRVAPSYMRDNTQASPVKHTISSNETKGRGIKDPRSFETYFGAFFSLMTIISIYAAIICTAFLVFFQEQKLLLIGPAAFLFFGICYLIWGQKARCCVCHQKQFVRKKRSLNKQLAHKFPLLSYVTSTALYATVRGCYRCMICGSSIRLFGKD